MENRHGPTHVSVVPRDIPLPLPREVEKARYVTQFQESLMAEEGLDVIGGPRGEVTQKFHNVQFLACLESHLTPGYPFRPGYRPRRVLFPYCFHSSNVVFSCFFFLLAMLSSNLRYHYFRYSDSRSYDADEATVGSYAVYCIV